MLGLWAGIALGADFIASDRPLLLQRSGRLFVAPNVSDPPELRRYTNQSLLEAMDEGDWAVLPPLPYGPNQHDLGAVLSPPTAEHPLGTDSHGRDVLARLVHGTRVSLSVASLAVLWAMSIGVLLGSLAGYFGGLWDLILMRVAEVIHSLPLLLLVIALSALWVPRGVSAVLALTCIMGATGWTEAARLLRAEILRVRAQEYVLAARALGCSSLRILVGHVLPNAIGPLLVRATFAFAAAILLESALSFLGFGVPPDMASWGALLEDGRQHMNAWWLALLPGSMLFTTVMACNVVGQGLRERLDPRAPLRTGSGPCRGAATRG